MSILSYGNVSNISHFLLNPIRCQSNRGIVQPPMPISLSLVISIHFYTDTKMVSMETEPNKSGWVRQTKTVSGQIKMTDGGV